MDHEAEHVPVTQLIPADGWRVYYYDNSDDSNFSSPIVSWGLRACGCVVPLVWKVHEQERQEAGRSDNGTTH